MLLAIKACVENENVLEISAAVGVYISHTMILPPVYHVNVSWSAFFFLTFNY